MSEKFKTLIENVGLSDEMKQALTEAWDEKVKEGRSQLATEIREEFAVKYKIDKKRIVESLTQMIYDIAEKESKKMIEEKQKMIKERLAMKENNKKFVNFAMKKLVEEVKDLHQDKKVLDENVGKFVQFFIGRATNELKEFKDESDKLTRTKIKLISESKAKIEEAKKAFNERAALLTSKWIKESIEKEFKEFRSDLNEARKNRLGRKIFEAMSAEFETEFFNKNAVAKGLMENIKKREAKLTEAVQLIKKQHQVLSKAKEELTESKDSLERNKIINETLSHLPKDKKDLMVELVDGIETKRLVESINKYLPMVLEEDNRSSKIRKTILENNNLSKKVVTGEKRLTSNLLTEGHEVEDDEINRIVYLSNTTF